MIFISHSNRDANLAASVERHLSDAGYSCWLDKSQIPVGERFVSEIGSALKRTSVFLLIATENTNDSYWVAREVNAARRLREYGVIPQIVVLKTAESATLEFTPDQFAQSTEQLMQIVADTTELTTDHKDPHSITIDSASTPPEPAVWFGFSDALRIIDDWWLSSGELCWISGLGGGGKTSLVLTWLRALSEIGFQNPLIASATTWSFYDVPHASQGIDHLEQWIHKHKDGNRIIFWDGTERLDEAGCIEVVRRAICHHCRVLATSRISPPSTLEPIARHLALASLTERDAKILIEKAGLEPDVAAHLSSALKGHPLTISIATSGIQQGTFSAQDILKIVNERSNAFQ